MSSITDNPPFGYTDLSVTQPGTESQDNLTWNNTSKRWEGSLFDIALTIGPANYTAKIYYTGGNTLLATGEYGSSTSIGNDTNVLYVEFVDDGDGSSLWIVEEVSGAAGDPHIKPFFGKDYTI